MARGFGSRGMRSTIKGLDADYVKAIRKAEKRILNRVGDDIADTLNDLAPSRKVNYQVDKATSSAVATVYSTHPGAKAMSEGSLIRPKKGGVLRFVNDSGEVVFTRKPIRTKGNKYLRRGLGKRRRIVLRAVDAELGTELAKAAKRGR